MTFSYFVFFFLEPSQVLTIQTVTIGACLKFFIGQAISVAIESERGEPEREREKKNRWKPNKYGFFISIFLPLQQHQNVLFFRLHFLFNLLLQ